MPVALGTLHARTYLLAFMPIYYIGAENGEEPISNTALPWGLSLKDP